MKRTTDLTISVFPLRTTQSVEGSRRLAREKVLQVLAAYDIAASHQELHFAHIFYRIFADEEAQPEIPHRMLRPEEIAELESDIPIRWRQSDINYAHRLFQETVRLRPFCDEQIERHALNWEIERIAHLDRQIMRLAIAEILCFPDIPVKVSINEALELAKRYSTDKSNAFINGILDATAHDLRSSGMITKPLEHSSP
ncbi:MAG: transcription antitermination factor NusB [Bacteroidota bacterium]|nr:transcription antitermination factor NusB [Candidatus Kapabacteria bacterium]MCS7301828.1 transcription antitermination factor NusB [Candidatus Kapabacteria bacterium]MCX7936081.1 transcription antitermination factor NusB [Chlorobiota bacterium]MDW8075025.1 transcription antitermination factor NusB [Bacteroidota bacterium]MDW8271664.1 transcription antitermination factor NusB [Bacteroidota bacterium]